MSHLKDEELAAFINYYYTPKDVKVKLEILPRQKDKNGECMISLRLRRYDPLKKKDIISRRRQTGIRVKPQNWSSKKEEVLSKDPEHKRKNNFIGEKKARYLNYIFNPSIDYKLAQLSKEEFLILEEVFPSPRILKIKKSLVDYIDDYHQCRKKKGDKKGTVKEFLTVRNRIKRFDDEKRGEKTYLPDVNIGWSDEFELWMQGEGYASGTIEKTYTVLRTVLHYLWEVRDEQNITMTDKYKSKYFKRGDKSRNKAHPLTPKQLEALWNHSFNNERLEKTRKMMCIQAYTGMRYEDIKTIRPEHIVDDFLCFRPLKTAHLSKPIDVEQPLNKYSRQLFAEVDNDTSCYSYANQPYNDAIKDVLVEMTKEYPKLKFKKDHTSHNLRDTFISNAVMKKVSWKAIIDWVGQRDYKMMDRYVKTTKGFEEREMDTLYGR